MIDPTGLSWDDLRLFVEVAQRGSLVEAARALRVSEATIGRRLRRLESSPQARLFDRLANRLVLTALGAELAQAGAAMQAGACAVARCFNARVPPAHASVRVTATGSVSLFLAGHARRLAELAGADGAGVELLTTKSVLDLVGGEAEIALRMRRLPEDGPLAARRLGRVAFSVYAARDLVDGLGGGEGWQGLDIIGLPQTSRTPSQAAWLDEAAAARGAPVRVRCSDVAVRYHTVRERAGASLLPCFLGDGDSMLVRLLDPPEELTQEVYLLLHEEGRRAARIRAVAEALSRVFREAGNGLRGRR